MESILIFILVLLIAWYIDILMVRTIRIKHKFTITVQHDLLLIVCVLKIALVVTILYYQNIAIKSNQDSPISNIISTKV